MSDHENSREGWEEASAGVVRDGSGSRHKHPYRPTDLQDDSRESHHKRARAPAVPSVSDELKTLSEDNQNENVDKARMSRDRVPSSEKFKQSVSKKLLSKKKASAADTLVERVELARVESSSPTQPIPQGVAIVSGTSVIDKSSEPRANKTEDEDIVEDTGLRTAVADTKHSEWDNQSSSKADTNDDDAFNHTEGHAEGDKRDAFTKKPLNSTACRKEVSWIDHQQYLPKLLSNEMGDECREVRLERKPSVGPCKSRTLYEGPSGISLYVPRKPSSSSAGSSYIYPQRSGINITISKKCLPVESKLNMSTQETRAVMVDPQVPYIKILSKLRCKYMSVREKVKNVLRFDS